MADVGRFPSFSVSAFFPFEKGKGSCWAFPLPCGVRKRGRGWRACPPRALAPDRTGRGVVLRLPGPSPTIVCGCLTKRMMPRCTLNGGRACHSPCGLLHRGSVIALRVWGRVVKPPAMLQVGAVVCEGRQGAVAAVVGPGTTAPLSPVEDTVPQWLRTGNVNTFLSEKASRCIHPEVPGRAVLKGKRKGFVTPTERAFTGTLSASWSRHGQDTRPQKQY